MHIRLSDVKGREISEGVTERILLKPDQTRPGGLSARHYVLTQGEVTFAEPEVEYQHYMVSGAGLFGRRLVHGDTAIFVPGSRRFGEPGRHSISHQGEGELRLISVTYRIPRPNFRWAKTRIKNLYEVPASLGNIYAQQLFTEEEHAVMGALRMHAIDVQTNPPLNAMPLHKNPEEIMYFLRGTGEAVSGEERHKVGPGSLVYTPEGETHAIFNTSDRYPLQYFVLEFIEHDRMWTERGLQG